MRQSASAGGEGGVCLGLGERHRYLGVLLLQEREREAREAGPLVCGGRNHIRTIVVGNKHGLDSKNNNYTLVYCLIILFISNLNKLI